MCPVGYTSHLCAISWDVCPWLIPIAFTVCCYLPASKSSIWINSKREFYKGFGIGYMLQDYHRESTLCCLRWILCEEGAMPETSNIVLENGADNVTALSAFIAPAYLLPYRKHASSYRNRAKWNSPSGHLSFLCTVKENVQYYFP